MSNQPDRDEQQVAVECEDKKSSNSFKKRGVRRSNSIGRFTKFSLDKMDFSVRFKTSKNERNSNLTHGSHHKHGHNHKSSNKHETHHKHGHKHEGHRKHGHKCESRHKHYENSAEEAATKKKSSKSRKKIMKKLKPSSSVSNEDKKSGDKKKDDLVIGNGRARRQESMLRRMESTHARIVAEAHETMRVLATSSSVVMTEANIPKFTELHMHLGENMVNEGVVDYRNHSETEEAVMNESSIYDDLSDSDGDWRPPGVIDDEITKLRLAKENATFLENCMYYKSRQSKPEVVHISSAKNATPFLPVTDLIPTFDKLNTHLGEHIMQKGIFKHEQNSLVVASLTNLLTGEDDVHDFHEESSLFTPEDENYDPMMFLAKFMYYNSKGNLLPTSLCNMEQSSSMYQRDVDFLLNKLKSKKYSKQRKSPQPQDKLCSSIDKIVKKSEIFSYDKDLSKRSIELVDLPKKKQWPMGSKDKLIKMGIIGKSNKTCQMTSLSEEDFYCPKPFNRLEFFYDWS